MHLLAVSASNLIGAGELAVAMVGLVFAGVFGVPAWRYSKDQNRKNRTAELAESMARYLGIPLPDHPADPIPRPNPDHPSIVDILTELRDYSSETAVVGAVLAHHIGDGHGRSIPPELMERLLTKK